MSHLCSQQAGGLTMLHCKVPQLCRIPEMTNQIYQYIEVMQGICHFLAADTVSINTC